MDLIDCFVGEELIPTLLPRIFCRSSLPEHDTGSVRTACWSTILSHTTKENQLGFSIYEIVSHGLRAHIPCLYFKGYISLHNSSQYLSPGWKDTVVIVVKQEFESRPHSMSKACTDRATYIHR